MSDCRWYEIKGFASTYEVASFEAYLAKQVADGHAEIVSTTTSQRPVEQKCFRWKATGAIWRLVPPKGTRRGFWQPVAD